MDFCRKPLPIIDVQGPQSRRWWVLTMATGAQCSVVNQPTTLELVSDEQNWPQYNAFCHKPLPTMAVQGPRLRRWWLRAKDAGAQCCVWNQPRALELTSDKQNYPKHVDFCYKPSPIIAVQGPQPRRYGFVPWPLGPSVVFEINTQCSNWRRTNKTILNTRIFVTNHCQ